jgi:anti-anti-sigma factor
MRARGVAGSVGGLGVSDHVCWTFGSDEEYGEFHDAALYFAADGMALRQRLFYVSERRDHDVLAHLRSLGDPEALRRDGALVVQQLADVYPGGGPITDPEAQLVAFDGAVSEAIADGFAGVRVVAEVSPLAADPAWRDGHAAWEQLADRYMAASNPLAALCGYDTRIVGRDGASMLASVHPVRHDATATFSVFADDGAVCLEGEVDAFQVPLLERALAAVPDAPGGEPLVVDLTELRFIDVAGTGVLARHIAGRIAGGAEVHVRRARPLVRRLWGMLDGMTGSTGSSESESAEGSVRFL